MCGYCLSSRHRVSWRRSPASAWKLNETSGSPWSGSCDSSSSTPSLELGWNPAERKARRGPGRPIAAAAHRWRETAAPGHQAVPPEWISSSSLACARTSAYKGVRGEELAVRPVGDDASLVEQHDTIGEADRGEAVGDDECGAPAS